nr:hypothetical protein [Tanacetum cinerariifolium]
MEEFIEKNNDLLAQTKVLKDQLQVKHIADQQVLFDKMSVQLVELDQHVTDLKNTVLEKDFKISELEEYACCKKMSEAERAKDAAYYREKMLLCKQEERGIQLNAEQADWKDD